MSLCATPPPFISYYERGVSPISQQLVRVTEQISNHASETISLGWREHLKQQLLEIQSRCNQSGWDGYQAAPICLKTLLAAIEFLKLLPNYIEMPDIVPEPTGEIGFLWEKGEDITLLVSVSPETIVVVELLGSSKSHGERTFPNRLPTNIEKTLLDYFRIK